MKKTTISITVAIATLLGTASSDAVQYTDYDLQLVFLNADQPGPGQKRFDGQFNVSPPYNPATDTLLSADVFFYYSDDDLTDAILGDGPFWGDGAEHVRLRLDDGNGGWNTLLNEEVGVLDNASEEVLGDAFVSLSTDGVLDYRVVARSGDFWFTGAKLVVEYSQNASVPDGGVTLALLGAAVFGLGAVYRRR